MIDNFNLLQAKAASLRLKMAYPASDNPGSNQDITDTGVTAGTPTLQTFANRPSPAQVMDPKGLKTANWLTSLFGSTPQPQPMVPPHPPSLMPAEGAEEPEQPAAPTFRMQIRNWLSKNVGSVLGRAAGKFHHQFGAGEQQP